MFVNGQIRPVHYLNLSLRKDTNPAKGIVLFDQMNKFSEV